MNRYTQLTQEERYQIDKRLAQDWSFSDIARELQRSTSTISRELKRNRAAEGYHPALDGKLAGDRRYRGGRPRIKDRDWRLVKRLLRRKLSPEQIRNRLWLEGGRSISHSWIYRYVCADRQAGGKLHRFLRHQGRRRRKYGSGSARGLIPARVSIHQRPAVVEQRRRIGDWEIDTIIGNRRRGALLSLTERKSKWLLLARNVLVCFEDLADAIQVRADLRLTPLLFAAVARWLTVREDLLHRLPVNPGVGQHLVFSDPLRQYLLADLGPHFHVRVHPVVLLGVARFDWP